MRELEFSAEVVRELDRARFEHPHPAVRRRMRVVWMWSQDFSQRSCARVGGVSERTVRRYLDAFQAGGGERLRELRWKGPARRLQPHAATLEASLQRAPSPRPERASKR